MGNYCRIFSWTNNKHFPTFILLNVPLGVSLLVPAEWAGDAIRQGWLGPTLVMARSVRSTFNLLPMWWDRLVMVSRSSVEVTLTELTYSRLEW